MATISVHSQRGEGDEDHLGAESATGQVWRKETRGGGELDHTTQLCTYVYGSNEHTSG